MRMDGLMMLMVQLTVMTVLTLVRVAAAVAVLLGQLLGWGLVGLWRLFRPRRRSPW